MGLIQNERGMALLLSILVVGLMILVLSSALTNHVSTVSSELAREKRILAGREALRDFSGMAQRAREVRVTNGGAGCPVGTTLFPAGAAAGVGFCFPNDDNVNFADCVRNPTTVDPNIRLCLRGAGNLLRLSLLERMQIEFIAMRNVFVRSFSNLAFAQADTHLPALAAPLPTVTMATPAVCSAVTPPSVYCKLCGINTTCVTLEVCLRNGGCPDADQWITQTIGVLDR